MSFASNATGFGCHVHVVTVCSSIAFSSMQEARRVDFVCDRAQHHRDLRLRDADVPERERKLAKRILRLLHHRGLHLGRGEIHMIHGIQRLLCMFFLSVYQPTAWLMSICVMALRSSSCCIG